jgi:hypothetical protein
MKVLFLAALIIACASTVTEVPSILLGTWNFDAAIGVDCGDYSGCINSVNFTTGENTTLNMNIFGTCNASYVMHNIVADDSDSDATFTLIPTNSPDWTGIMTNTTVTGLDLLLQPPGLICEISLLKSATLMKATIVAVVAAAAWLL